jgi:hypothetical protein
MGNNGKPTSIVDLYKIIFAQILILMYVINFLFQVLLALKRVYK